MTSSIATDWHEEYTLVTSIGNHGECGLCELLYTTAIVSGLNSWGYEDRWCYHTYLSAARALVEWIANPDWPEPKGWHRHPDSGRRRPDGDASKEYINK